MCRVMGWMRLWMLTSVLLGIGIVIYGFNTIPTESQITALHEAAMRALKLDLHEKRAGIGQTGPSSPSVGTSLTVEELKRRIVKEDHDHLDAIGHLPTKQALLCMTLGLMWLGVIVALYIAGWLVHSSWLKFRERVSE